MIRPLEHLSGSQRLWLGLMTIAILIVSATWYAWRQFHSVSYADVLLGCQKVEGVAESGFHYQEEAAASPFRWTNGRAKLLIPIDRRRPPHALWVSIGTLRPKMEKIPLQVLVDGTVQFDEPLPPGNWEHTFDLAGHSFSDTVLLELRSATFVPKGVMDQGRSTDTRVLGVQVKGIMLKREER